MLPFATRILARPMLARSSHLHKMMFLPSRVTVNEGDTITWKFQGFHTVSFLGGEHAAAGLAAGGHGAGATDGSYGSAAGGAIDLATDYADDTD